MKRYEAKKSELEAELKATGPATDRTAREAELSGLRDRQNAIRAKLALVQNYGYVDKPCVRTDPVSPRPWRNFWIFGFLGLLGGVMLALLGHFIKTVYRGA
jgi:LPS O-antigen subunit length determinant protein (WzzB/FepE family)